MGFKYTLILLLFLASSYSFSKEYTIALGTVSEQEFTSFVPSGCNEKNVICMSGWVRWHIKINTIVSGEQLENDLVVANLQHSLYLHKKNANFLFVIERTESKSIIKNLRTHYVLKEFSLPQTIYCTQTPLKEYNPGLDIIDSVKSNCIETSQFKGEIVENTLIEIAEYAKNKLKKEGKLIRFVEIDPPELDDECEEDESNEEFLENEEGINCQNESPYFIYHYIVNSGFADYSIAKIKQRIDDIGLNINDVDMKFEYINGDNNEFKWYFKIK